MNDTIQKKANQIQDELVRIRREIHTNPELGLEEFKTGALVAGKLEELGIAVKTGVGETGVVGILNGTSPGKTLLIRADMDCLAMQELNDVPYKSQVDGQMHACGHDAHTTWVLGAAMILSEMRDHFKGTVKFVFQPAEEGQGGANRMIQDGVLSNPTVDAAIGAHVWPIVDAGKIGVKRNSMMAAPDMFHLTIKGQGGHGAEPHNCIDPISIGCQVYSALQTIVSRKINPVDSAVLSITQFNAGSAHNVIPNEVKMSGTVRTLLPETRDNMPKMMEKLISGIVEANGGSYDLEYTPYYPPVINDPEITDLVKHAASEVLGHENVVELPVPTMGGEDFSYFQQKVPGTFFVVGTRNEAAGLTNALHNPYFDIDESILSKASAVLSRCALEYLK